MYQPQVELSSGRIVGIEVLSRWYSPELGHVSPIEFIATAERMGMIVPLTQWVLEATSAQASEWYKAGYFDARIAVNISPTQFSTGWSGAAG